MGFGPLPLHRHAAYLLPAIAILVLQSGEPHWGSLLSLEPDRVLAGEWWRAITGQWVHFTWYHTFYNATALAMCGYILYSPQKPRHWLGAMGCIVVTIGVALSLLESHMTEYRGTSGLVYGLVIVGVWRTRERMPWLYIGFLLFMIGKIIYEQTPLFDPTYLQHELGASVASAAHLWGLLGAGLYLGLCALARFWFNPDKADAPYGQPPPSP